MAGAITSFAQADGVGISYRGHPDAEFCRGKIYAATGRFAPETAVRSRSVFSAETIKDKRPRGHHTA